MISEFDVGSDRSVATEGHSFSVQLVILYDDLKMLVGTSHLITYDWCHSPNLLVLARGTTILDGVEAGIRRIRYIPLHRAHVV